MILITLYDIVVSIVLLCSIKSVLDVEMNVQGKHKHKENLTHYTILLGKYC